MERVDAIIIGSGQGGVPLATSLADEGKDVVVFERGSWGGSCINYGCTPSKMFLASAHLATRARESDDLGVHADVEVDFPAVMERIRGIIGSWSDGVKTRLENAGVRIVEASASFVDTRTVSGGDLTVEAPLVVIDTGKSPAVPPIPGIEEVPYRTYVDFWELEERPARTVIVGGGYVGVELGQGIARLGSETRIVEISDRLASHEEPEVSEALEEALREDGVIFDFDTEVSEVSHNGGEFIVTLENEDPVTADLLVMATGRKPNTEALAPGESGIEVDAQGHVKVDEKFRTSCKGVYAIGDVTGQPAFTHVSWEDYRRLRAILQSEDRSQGDRVLAYVFFTDPQVGHAGLTEEQAEAKGFDARAVTMPLEEVARATEVGRTRGFYCMVIDDETDRILGATLVGPQAGELIHVFIAHMEAGSTWQTLDQSVHVHPTFSEGLPSLARKLK